MKVIEASSRMEADLLQSVKFSLLGRDDRDSISYIINAACINATDTVYLEKARPEEDLEILFMATISDHLSFNECSPKVVAFFVSNGVRR